MCLPDFIEFKNLELSEAVTGYRNWKVLIKDDGLELRSSIRDYIWKVEEKDNTVKEKNSGIYSYNYNNNNNNYYNNNNNNYYYYYYNNNYYYYNYYNNYNIAGVILQWGKVAIHKIGYRSKHAIVKTLFTIRESDAKGPQEFLDWIKVFNSKVEAVAKKYNANTMHWQDFVESQKGDK